VRKDLGEANFTAMQSGFGRAEGAPTSYVVGGYSAGVALRIGLRFDRATGLRAPETEPGRPG
jgi:hypothetical protein